MSLPLEYHTGAESWDFYTSCEGFFVSFSPLPRCFPCSSKPSPEVCSAGGYRAGLSLCHPTSKPSSLAQSPSLIHPHAFCCACPPMFRVSQQWKWSYHAPAKGRLLLFFKPLIIYGMELPYLRLSSSSFLLPSSFFLLLFLSCFTYQDSAALVVSPP